MNTLDNLFINHDKVYILITIKKKMHYFCVNQSIIFIRGPCLILQLVCKAHYIIYYLARGSPSHFSKVREAYYIIFCLARRSPVSYFYRSAKLIILFITWRRGHHLIFHRSTKFIIFFITWRRGPFLFFHGLVKLIMLFITGPTPRRLSISKEFVLRMTAPAN